MRKSINSLAPAKVKLLVEVDPVARDIKELIIESRNLSKQIKFTGSKWTCELEEFNVDPSDNENDLDIFMRLEGEPLVSCPITVKVNDNKPLEFINERFNKNGWLFFIKSIALKDLKDEE